MFHRQELVVEVRAIPLEHHHQACMPSFRRQNYFPSNHNSIPPILAINHFCNTCCWSSSLSSTNAVICFLEADIRWHQDVERTC